MKGRTDSNRKEKTKEDQSMSEVHDGSDFLPETFKV